MKKKKYKLSLIIPMYNEGEEVIKPMLDSIVIQQNVDLENEVEVVVVNDGGDPDRFLSDEFIKSYPFDIHYFKKEHGGVSAARNYGFDHSTGEYVMFCDCDDMFYNACGLWIIFEEFKVKGGFDTMTSLFIEEGRDTNGNIVYVRREEDSTFVHGKVHRRKYLEKESIRWNSNLTIHEDSYFNVLCQNLTKKFKYCQSPFYLWKWRKESVCRHDPKYILKTFNNMLDSADALVQEFTNRGKDKHANLYCCSMVFESYYTMNKIEWIDQENQEYRNAVERHFSEWFKKWKYIWDRVPENERIQLSTNIRQKGIQEGKMMMENITMKDWLDHIEKLS